LPGARGKREQWVWDSLRGWWNILELDSSDDCTTLWIY
jgi:hypothetical protein